MDFKKTIEFLVTLKSHNDRDWFQKNKKYYDPIKEGMLEFLGRLIPEIAMFDPEAAAITPKDCIFRIYRDVRFSKDKSPYKTHIGAFISKSGRKGNHPGYYLHMEPGESFVAGGLYMPVPNLLKAIRNEIYFNTAEFKSIISHPDFLEYFGKLDDSDKLKRPPKGFSTDWPDNDLVKYRSYVVNHHLAEESLYIPNPESIILPVFRAMLPLNKFLNKAQGNMENE